MALTDTGNNDNTYDRRDPHDPWEPHHDPYTLPIDYYLNRKYKFLPFYYPYADLLVQQFNRHGIAGVLNPDGSTPADEALTLQKGLQGNFAFDFDATYTPHKKSVMEPYPLEGFDFNFGGAYSDYNWEMFFHNPVLAADRLSQNQKFEEAQKWFHYIFDPTISFDPADGAGLSGEALELKKRSRFWRLKPFHEFTKQPNIERLLAELSQDADTQEVQDLENEIGVWRANPFKPHLVAQIRVVSYMKYVVMKYLDNIIAWGDSLFRQDTLESINEATQHYLLAASILGERPQKISRTDTATKSYRDIYDTPAGFDEMSNALVQLENGITGSPVARGSSNAASSNGLTSINLLFFCIPSNKKMEEYWDTVADRLFKIRNCQNIDGVERQLALFAPAIDPLALVKAVGRGGSYLAAVQNLSIPLAPYRFTYMVQRALELCGDVKNLGSALLSALEKKDAEIIAGIRNQHEIKVLDNLRHAKKLAIDEANQAIETLVQSKDNVSYRFNYYNSREYMNAQEKQQLDKLKKALDIEIGVTKTEAIIGALEAVPAISFGANGPMGSPHFATRIDAKTLSALAQSSLRIVRTLAEKERFKANRASIKAGYDRRRDDWRFQAETAKIELKQIDKQIEGAYHRREIALYELDLNEKQLQNAEEIAEVMETKYTNKELYSWMISEISKLYFRSYRLALDVAKTAERCFQFERPDSNETFIDNFNWNSLKKGLLAGDYLNDNLRRMQQAFDQSNNRRLELKKNVSLAIIDPDALINLRTEGGCTFDIPEVLFDLDFPGHYKRRIKSVSITIPCVVGPNGNIPAKLVLSNNSVRTKVESGTYTHIEENFVIGRSGTQSIATSTANRDSGLFELNFNDQRYLPFEGAGVISTWRLDLPDPKISQFDYNTISDVIVHIDYEAEDAGNRDVVTTYLKGNIDQIITGEGVEDREDWSILIGLSQQFSSNLHQFFNPQSGNMKTDLPLTNQYFPHLFRDKNLIIESIDFTMIPKSGKPLNGGTGARFKFSDGTHNQEVNVSYDAENSDNNFLKVTATINSNNIDPTLFSIEKVQDTNNTITDDNIEDIYMVVNFKVATS